MKIYLNQISKLVFLVALIIPNYCIGQQGTLDTTFSYDGKAFTPNQQIIDFVIQSDGKIIAGGNTLLSGSVWSPMISRINPDGLPDYTFGNAGIKVINGYGNLTSMAIQNDGKIVISTVDAIIRLNPNGDYDSTFSSNGITCINFTTPPPQPIYSTGCLGADKVIILSNGKIILGNKNNVPNYGGFFNLARLLPNGNLDSTFGINGKKMIRDHDFFQDVFCEFDDYYNATSIIEGINLVMQNDGKFVVGVVSNGNFCNKRIFLSRFTSSGNVDSTFGINGIIALGSGISAKIYDIGLQPDGKILIAGEGSQSNGRDFYIARCFNNGFLDSQFDFDGSALIDMGGNEWASTVKLQCDGKILLGGSSYPSQNEYNWGVVRLNTDGSLDNSFDVDGRVLFDFNLSTNGFDYDYARDIEIQNDGKILVGGEAQTSTVPFSGTIIRLNAICFNNQPPTASFTTSSNTTCENSCVTFSNTSANDSTWLWLFPGGTPASSNLENPPQVCYPNSGTYSVTLITSNSFGTDTLILNNAITVASSPLVSANSNSPLCIGQNLNLSSSSGFTYSWSGPNGFASSIQNPTITNAGAVSSGIYFVTVTASNGCTATDSVSVTVNNSTLIQANSNSPVCERDNINLNSTPGTSYSWSGPNGFSSNQQNPTINNATASAAGSYTLVSNNGCGADTVNITVNVNPSPTAQASYGNAILCAGINLNLVASGGGTYSWTGPNNFSSLQQNPTLSNLNTSSTGTYTVTVTANNGCSDSASVLVDFDSEGCLTIPSVFTPNGDGVNDGWVINGIESYPNCSILVFNRWGQKLFETVGYTTPWDGTFEGADCPIADYYYVIDLKNNTPALTGTITIKR
ncbi:MAG: T9SS type B sorting domain-containing protein [Arcticibacter sp.]